MCVCMRERERERESSLGIILHKGGWFIQSKAMNEEEEKKRTREEVEESEIEGHQERVCAVDYTQQRRVWRYHACLRNRAQGCAPVGDRRNTHRRR